MSLASSIAAENSQILADWGDTAVLTHGGADSAAITGMFNDQYFEMSLQQGGVSTAKAAFLCASAAVAGAILWDKFTVTSPLFGLVSQVYYIAKIEKNPPDAGPGFSWVVLSKDKVR